MTTSDTAAVRSWARKNGHVVAERGRLPAELHEAYLAAQGGPATAPRKGATAAKAPAAKAAPAKKKAAATKSVPSKAATTRAAKAPAKTAVRTATTAPKPAAAAAPKPAAAPVAVPAPVDVHAERLAALEEQVAALTTRIAVLEKPANTPNAAAAAKPSLFRRRNG